MALLSVVSLWSLKVADVVQGGCPWYEEPPHVGRHVGELPLALWSCLRSLVYLPPSLGLARKSTDSCKIANLWERRGRKTKGIREKNGAAYVWTRRLPSRTVLGAQRCLFRRSRISSCQLPIPSLWEVRWLLGPEKPSVGSQAQKQTWSPAFGNCWSFLSLFLLLEKQLALRNRGWEVFRQLDSWHTHWSLRS